MVAQDGTGKRRRTRSLDERKRIVEEALAPGVSVAAVARRHGLNANFIFKWIRRCRKGWRERRRGAAKEKPGAAGSPDTIAPAFVPVKPLELDAPQRHGLPMSSRSRLVRRAEAQGAARWRSVCRTAPRCRSTLRSTPRRRQNATERWAWLDAPVRAGRSDIGRPRLSSLGCAAAR